MSASIDSSRTTVNTSPGANGEGAGEAAKDASSSSKDAASAKGREGGSDVAETGDDSWLWGRPLGASTPGERGPGSVHDTGSADDLAPFGLLTATDLGEGALIAGRYAIRSLLGSGGMGRVFLAEHVGVGRMVAVKILDRQRSSLPPIVRRFQGEAKAANVVDHPSIAAVFDCGALDDGRLYLAMEYVRGVVLSDLIRKEGTLEWRRAVRLALEVSEGMAEVHRAGLVHRDLKPSNLMIVRPGDEEGVKILDFGVASRLESASAIDGRITRPGQLVGTPLYMAPEQTQGAPATPAMDVYAIGVILYEMIRGELPHFDHDPFDLVARKRRLEAPRLIGVPEALGDLVAEALSIDPARRPEDAGALAERLAEILEPEVVPPAPRRRRFAWFPLAAAAGLLASLILLSLGQSRAGMFAPLDAEVPERPLAKVVAVAPEPVTAADPRADAVDPDAVDPNAVDPNTVDPGAGTSDGIEGVASATTASVGAATTAAKSPDEPGPATAAAEPRDRPATRPGPAGERKARCDLARKSVVEARQAHEWGEVLRYSEEAACWPDREARRTIRVKAAYELGDHKLCRREGEGASDPGTVKMVELCAQRLGAG
ncbi:MAG: protein kinase [Nannocystaceae bacterium]